MSSQAQIDANRLNAKKSTGPRTPKGRAAVRLNGVMHGLTAKTLILKDESESGFRAIFDTLEAEHQPSTPTEELLVFSQLAMAAWRLRRLYHMESGFFRIRSFELQPSFEKYTNLQPGSRQAIIVKDDADSPHALDKFCRYEARLERSFYRALHEPQRLRAQRPAKAATEVEKPKLALVGKTVPKAPLPPAVPPQTPSSQPNPRHNKY